MSAVAQYFRAGEVLNIYDDGFSYRFRTGGEVVDLGGEKKSEVISTAEISHTSLLSDGWILTQGTPDAWRNNE